MQLDEALRHAVEVAQVLEDAAFEYERAVEAGEHTAEAKELLDRARAANGTARFLCRTVLDARLTTEPRREPPPT